MYIIENLIKLKGRDFYNYIKTEQWKKWSSLNKIDDSDTKKLCEFIIKNAHLKKTIEIINEISLERFSSEQKKMILVASIISGKRNMIDYFLKEEFICDGYLQDTFAKIINNYIFTENKISFKDNFFLLINDSRIKDTELVIKKISLFPFKTSDFIYINEKISNFYTSKELKKRFFNFITERKIKIDIGVQNIIKNKLLYTEDFINIINEKYNTCRLNQSFVDCLKIKEPEFFLNKKNFEILIHEKIHSVYARSVISDNYAMILQEFLLAMDNRSNFRAIKSLTEIITEKLEKDLSKNKGYFYSYNKINEKILNYSRSNGFIQGNEVFIKVSSENLERKEIENIILFYKKLPALIEKVIINNNIKINDGKKVLKRL